MSVSEFQPDEVLDRVCIGLRQQSIPEFPNPDIVWQIPNAKPSTIRPPARLASRRFQVAAIAAVFLAILGTLLFPWNSAGSRVFAQVQEAIADVKSVTFRIETFTQNTKSASYKVSHVSPDDIRAEGADDAHVVNGKESRVMDVWYPLSKAEIRPIYDRAAFAQRVLGAYAQLFELKGSVGTEVVEKVIDGRNVQLFSMTFDGGMANVVVDSQSHLPVRIEVDRGKDQEGRAIREVIDQFVFNEPIDSSLFAITPPDGFAVDVTETVSPDASTESYVVSPERGLGPAKFGMTTAEVTAIFGKPDKVVTREGMEVIVDGEGPNRVPDLRPGGNTRMVPADPKYTLDEVHYDSRGFRVTVSSKEGLVSIRCFEALVMGPSSRKFLGKTPEGIAIGSSWDEVIEAYGEPSSKLNRRSAMYSKPLAHFEFRDAKVISITLRSPHGE